MKPREFWIVEAKQDGRVVLRASSVKPRPPWDETMMHVREVVPLDWEKVWEELNKEFEWNKFGDLEKSIQQLVEKQLAGEE